MRGRVPALVHLKYDMMMASPFAYFRGAVPVMAADLAALPNTGILCQICGDAHVRNLGAYAAPDGRLLFDINDFDETICGPFEWDVKRMATSILLAGQDAGINDSGSKTAARAFLMAYCSLIHRLSSMGVLEVARFQVHGISRTAPVSQVLLKAERATPLHLREKLTIEEKGKRIFRESPPDLLKVRAKDRQLVLAGLKIYRKSLSPERQHFFNQLQPLDVAFKVVGVGSVGVRDYCVYLEGYGPDDPVFLQIKEEPASAYALYLPKRSSPSLHNGRRVVDGQRALQVQSDPLLGWTSITGRDYLVRQLKDHKAGLDVSTLDAEGLVQYADVCGHLLAHGHARSSDPRPIAGYVGGNTQFIEAMMEFASLYAEQTGKDWKEMISHQGEA